MAGGGLQASASMGLLTAPSRTSLTDGASSINATPFTLSLMPNPTVLNRNPEADSFMYIETLLESLAVLGKLGHALDIVAQKVPQEVFGLVETTLDEVAERAEYGRRASLNGPINAMSSGVRIDNIYYLSLSGTAGALLGPGALGMPISTMSGTTAGNHALMATSSLRLAALELTTKRVDQEIMRDLFWTLYSKLDAIAQGLRVVYEVSNRIGSVSV